MQLFIYLSILYDFVAGSKFQLNLHVKPNANRFLSNKHILDLDFPR